MNLGSRWLSVFLVALALAGSQGHGDPSARNVKTPQAKPAEAALSPPPCAFTFQDFDDEDDHGGKHAKAGPLFSQASKHLISPPVIASQAIPVPLPAADSTVESSGQLTCGPPADA